MIGKGSSSGRELPKAYLRLDPDVDQKHPDNLAEFIRLICSSARQRPRGRFASREVLEALFGKAAVLKFYSRADVIEQPDGSVCMAGWDDWQEGDMTVAERVRRTRRKKSNALPDRYPTVTEAFPEPLPIPLPPSLSTDSPNVRDSEGDIKTEDDTTPFMETITAVEQISGRVWSYRPGSWAWEELQADVRDFGPVQVISLMRSSGIKYPDGGQLVKFAHAALHPLSAVRAPKLVDPSLQADRARDEAAAEKRRKRREEIDGQ
jgi:hypothetical protein